MKVQKRVLVDSAGNVQCDADGNTEERFFFWCPGCNSYMWFDLKRWKWNGDFEHPTVEGSILFQGEERCHLHIRNGNLEFCDDCTHALVSQVYPMDEVKL